MRRTLAALAALVLLATALGSAAALTGTNGYEAVQLFTAADVVNEVADWSGLTVTFGDATPAYPGDAVAVDSSGRVYVQVYGVSGTSEYTGIVRSDADGTNLTGVLKAAWAEVPAVSDWFGQIRNVVIAPVTAGLMTKDDLVVVRDGYDAVDGDYMEIVVVDADDPTSTSLVHRWAPGGWLGGGLAHLTIDPSSGDLFFMQFLYDSSSRDGSIRKLTWNGSSYDESTVTTDDTAALDLIVGADGYLYTLDAGSTSTQKDPILRVDPDATDSWSTYAYVEINAGPSSYYGWAWDSEGTFWVADFGLRKGSRQGRITEIKAGRIAGARDRIAECGTALIYGMCAGPSGTLYVVESGTSVYQLAPSSGGGGGGGHGKNK